MRKFTRTEGNAQPLTPSEVEHIFPSPVILAKLTPRDSELTDAEREELNSTLDKSDSD